MSRKSIPYRDVKIDMLRQDPSYAEAYLDAVLEDGDDAEITTTLRDLARAFGGIPEVARQSNLNPTTLYRTLSPKGNPSIKTLRAILNTMDLRLKVEAKPGSIWVRSQ